MLATRRDSTARARPRAWLPAAALLAAATFWGVLWYPLRLLEAAGLPGLWATLVLFGAASLAGLPWAWRRPPGREALPWLVALAAASGWCNLAFVLAVLEGEVVRVLLLFYLSPAWAALLGRACLGERLGSRGLAAVLLALAGAGVILWDPALGLPWPLDRADALALSSGLAFAAANVLVRGGRHLPAGQQAWWSWAGVAATAAAGLLLADGPAPQAGAAAWAGAAALGALGVGGMTAALLYGVRRMPVHRSAVILLFEVLAGALSAHLLADEPLGLRTWAGGALVLGAAWLVSRPAGGRRAGSVEEGARLRRRGPCA